eukprot:scaffold4831_cov47-Phaeocystis_antarctica.AAC.1
MDQRQDGMHWQRHPHELHYPLQRGFIRRAAGRCPSWVARQPAPRWSLPGAVLNVLMVPGAPKPSKLLLQHSVELPLGVTCLTLPPSLELALG